MLASVLASIIDVAGHVGLPVLFIVIALESTGVPLPGETALFAAAILASNGKLSIVAVIVVAAAAAIIGDNAGYLIGRRVGRKLLTTPGPFYEHRQTVLRVGEPFFARHGSKAVFLGRFFAGLRITAAWMAGITRMHWLTFVFWNALGGVVWATAEGLLGYYSGHAAERVFNTVGVVGVSVIGVALVGLIGWRFVVRRRRSAAAAPAGPPANEIGTAAPRERPPAGPETCPACGSPRVMWGGDPEMTRTQDEIHPLVSDEHALMAGSFVCRDCDAGWIEPDDPAEITWVRPYWRL
jgi:membrane-associated protein